MASTLSFSLRVLIGRILTFQDRACPYCQSSETQAVGRKHLILQLRECRSCGLKYRFPKDEPAYAESYYENGYQEPTATDLPAKELIPGLIAKGFRETCFDKAEKVDFILDKLGEGWKELIILDFGANFGDLLSQLRSRGAKHLLGFEISRKRARFGVENVGEDILSDSNRVLGHRLFPYDVILASHVLEHLTDIGYAFELFRKAIKHPGGRLFIWAPNASKPALDRFHNGSWAPLVGEPHTLALDYDFFMKSLPKHGFRIVQTGDPSDHEIRLIAQSV